MTCLETLPDEILLNICGYLRCADVFYSFYNLNNRLNITIAGYCRYVNLMSVSHKQFEYSIRHVIPQIGYFIRSFILNGNWETIINEELSSLLYNRNLSLLFPQLQRLTIKWFNSTKFLSLINSLQNLSHLIHIDIRYLKGEKIDLIQSKLLSINENQLEIISFDHDSIDFDISEYDSTQIYSNLQQFSINLISHKLISRLFSLIPNISYLQINIDELNDNGETKTALNNLSILKYLKIFQLRSINLFWTFYEIEQLFKSMPILEKLSLDFRTDDQRLVTQENLKEILPLTLKKLDFFIRYYYGKSCRENEIFTCLSSTNLPIVCLLDKPRYRYLIHTVPCDLHSIILTGTIAKQMLIGWKYTKQIEDLYIYDIISLYDLIDILQHFRRLKTLSIDMKDKSQILTLSKQSSSIYLKFPYLKQIETSGICDIYPLLNAAPNVDYLIIDFECLKLLTTNEITCQILRKQIIRLNIIDWIDIQSDLLENLSHIFTSLRHIVITMKDLTIFIDQFILRILSLWKDRLPLSIDIKGSLTEENKTNIRQWIIKNSYINEHDSFAIEYKNHWFDLWF